MQNAYNTRFEFHYKYQKMDRLKFLMLTKIHYNRNTIVCVCLCVVFFMVVKLKGVVHFKKKLLLIIYSPP